MFTVYIYHYLPYIYFLKRKEGRERESTNLRWESRAACQPGPVSGLKDPCFPTSFDNFLFPDQSPAHVGLLGLSVPSAGSAWPTPTYLTIQLKGHIWANFLHVPECSARLPALCTFHPPVRVLITCVVLAFVHLCPPPSGGPLWHTLVISGLPGRGLQSGQGPWHSGQGPGLRVNDAASLLTSCDLV